uniref:Uncharacterized protein n=1 Tax=Parascaris equorum TaxID=6256 RepID=A0A914S4B2_PAREQ
MVTTRVDDERFRITGHGSHGILIARCFCFARGRYGYHVLVESVAANIVSLTSKTVSQYRCFVNSAKVTAESLDFLAIVGDHLAIFVYHKNTASRTGRQPDKLAAKQYGKEPLRELPETAPSNGTVSALIPQI